MRRRFVLMACVLSITVPASAAGSPESEKRKQLLERLGIDRPPPKAPPAEPDAPEPDAPEPDAPEPDGRPDETPGEPPSGAHPPAKTPPPKGPTYEGKVHKLLAAKCHSCHKSGGPAGATKFVMSGDRKTDYGRAKRFVKGTRPSASPLLTKAAGKSHAGGVIFAEGSASYSTVRDWIAGGSPRGGSSGAPAPAPGPAPPPVVGPTPPPATPTSPPKAPRKAKRPASDPPTPADPAAEPDAPVEPAPDDPAPTAPEPATRTREVFAPRVHDLLLAKCQSCHRTGGLGGNGAFVLSGTAGSDYATSKALVNVRAPDDSRLLTKARGVEHGGGATLAADGPELAAVRRWIADGALGPTAADVPAEKATAPVEPGDAIEVDATTQASPPPATGDRLGDGTPLGAQTSAPSPLPFGLPFHLHLNGKLDFSYERRDFRGHPFGPGRNAFQTYHHFLFLSRAGADDPFGFNVELITQSFYEFNARIAPPRRKFDFLFKAGKILVPFGPEPIFHKSYGGRSGFDQEILPLIWAQPGIAATAHVRAGPIAISDDVYTVQGYALREEDAILNLQSDTSSVDEFRAAFGNRIGVSWRPLTGWYSAQVNRLGFDRVLFMQALDLELWRLPDVPVLEDLVLAVGAMRADVSGGGEGRDYYHFGSYGTVGYYPLSWLYLQYRAGLRTTDNRRGLYFDDRRLDERDRGSHNVSIVGRYRGFYAGLQWFWNLERANELDDDFLRLTVGYEF